MRRRLFFWLDKLKITRTERQAISILLIIFTILLILNATVSSSSPFDEAYYSELDNRFRMRTALMQQQEQQILARYSGKAVQVAGQDTLPADSTAANRIIEIPESALININTADTSSLQQLRGIGAAYAQRIIEYRQQNGLFQSVNELLKIKGIGEKRLQKIRSFITLGEGEGGQAVSKIEAEPQVFEKAKIRNKPEKAPFIINVNKADAETLQKLSGIGPAYARRIVEYRHLNGPFKTKEQLLDIKGIGEKRLAKINPFIKLTDQD